MLKSQQQFEGPDLEALLDRVRAELGSDVQIVAANRVRRGGVGGFFSREHFEVIAEPAKPSPKTAIDLGNLKPSRESVIDTAAYTTTASNATSVLDLAEAVNGTERSLQQQAMPAVSTESERFVQILERIARDVETKETIAQPLAQITMQPTPRPLETHLAVTEQIQSVVTSSPVISPFDPPRVRRKPETDVLERPETSLARLGLPARFIPRGESGVSLRPALIESLAALPVPSALPDSKGVVVVVVGIGAQPVILGRQLCAERGLDPNALVLATEQELGPGVPSWLQITDAPTADERRRSWRRREQVTLVALSVSSVSTGSDWARTMLDHLEPTHVWGIVDAGWKVEDASSWATRLGGFDVLALVNLENTVSPASALVLDIPVARIDGTQASPLRWAEVLTERLVRR